MANDPNNRWRLKNGFIRWQWILAAAIVIFTLIPYLTGPGGQSKEVPYSQVKSWLKEGKVAGIEIGAERAKVRLTEAAAKEVGVPATTQFRSYIPATGDPGLLELAEASNVMVTAQPKSTVGAILLGILPWVALFGLYFWFWNRMQSNLTGRFGGRSPSDFLAGSAKKETKSAPRVTFDDVAGQDNAKREVAEIVDFLRDPQRFQNLGAEPPRGVLLVGPPGTGKTLLARALAGEADVAFFHTSASEFIEMFVGVGASRVRQMFDEAKKRAPAIIFIDELDAVGRVRGTGLGGGNDEREQTLNQILSELDGFSGREAVVVLAATNRPDVLDPALLRPGRFDRHVTLELPDRKARRAILDVHCRGVPLGRNIDLDLIATAVPGFSGADIKNLVNEAAISAARDGRPEVTMEDFDGARDKLIMGTLRTLAIKGEEKHRLAVHEAGHTAAAYYSPNADPLYKVTIIPRGRALGGTHLLPEEAHHTLPEDYLRTQLTVTLAGRVAERLFLQTVSSGADDDIQKATELARAMVARWGMAPEIGPVDLRQSEEHPFLGREIAQPRRFSETTAHAVDKAVSVLLNAAEDRAREILESNRPAIERLIAELEDQETLDQAQIAACLSGPGKVAATGR